MVNASDSIMMHNLSPSNCIFTPCDMTFTVCFDTNMPASSNFSIASCLQTKSLATDLPGIVLACLLVSYQWFGNSGCCLRLLKFVWFVLYMFVFFFSHYFIGYFTVLHRPRIACHRWICRMFGIHWQLDWPIYLPRMSCWHHNSIMLCLFRLALLNRSEMLTRCTLIVLENT